MEVNSKVAGVSRVDRSTDVLLSRSVMHIFSDISKKDTFRLTLNGATLLTGKARFDIIDTHGQLLYTETFSSVWLLGFADEQNQTPRQKEGSILRRADTFFDEANFSKPAIQANELFDADYSDKSTWLTIKSDPHAVGFNFLIGEENSRKIAFSRKYKKVLVFFSCC